MNDGNENIHRRGEGKTQLVKSFLLKIDECNFFHDLGLGEKKWRYKKVSKHDVTKHHDSASAVSLSPCLFDHQYEVAKDRLAKNDWVGQRIPEPVQQMIAGGLAGCASWLPPVYCLDVVKTRIQTAEPGVYSSMGDCAAKTWR